MSEVLYFPGNQAALSVAKAAVQPPSSNNTLPIFQRHAHAHTHTLQKKSPTITPTKHLPTISHTYNHRRYASVSRGHPRIAELQPSILLTPLSSVCKFPRKIGLAIHNDTEMVSVRDSEAHRGDRALCRMARYLLDAHIILVSPFVVSVSQLKKPEASPLLLWLPGL